MSFFNSIGRMAGRGSKNTAASSATNSKRSPTPNSASADPNHLQAQSQYQRSGPPSPRISPSSSQQYLSGTVTGASNGAGAYTRSRSSSSANRRGSEDAGGDVDEFGRPRGNSVSGAEERKKEKEKEKPLYMCSPFVEAALVKGNFRTIVMLPKYVDIMEWVAVNIFDFYTNLNEFYGVISEVCTASSCPTMSASSSLSYTWINQDRKSVHLPAPTYIDYVMTWVQNLIDDEAVFPTKSGHDFPPNFPSLIKHVYRQLLRVFAHIYHGHFHHILHLRSEPHFNSLFAHFLAFGREYDLLEVKDVKGSSGGESNGKGGGGVTGEVGVGLLWERWREMGILDG